MNSLIVDWEVFSVGMHSAQQACSPLAFACLSFKTESASRQAGRGWRGRKRKREGGRLGECPHLIPPSGGWVGIIASWCQKRRGTPWVADGAKVLQANVVKQQQPFIFSRQSKLGTWWFGVVEGGVACHYPLSSHLTSQLGGTEGVALDRQVRAHTHT